MTHNSADSTINLPGSSAPLSPSSMAITKRIHPGALTIEKGSSHKNTARPIPAFLTKLFTMVNDPSTDHLIKWNEPSGNSFFVVSSERFGRELLPKYFKHSNFGSFVRQLNMYGFHKVPHLNQGVLQGEIPETEMLEFTNLNFQRGQPDLLCLIQRKKPSPELTNPTTNDGIEPLSTALPSSSSNPNNELQVILADIASIRKHQSLISSDLETLQSSNAHLWKEAIANRDRNKRCQDTISKILAFLAQVFAGKLSSLQDPPPGNSGSNTSRTGVNLNRTPTDDHPMGILIREGGSIPERERHRSRPQNSRDHQHSHLNNLGFPSTPSNSALSLYSKMRHPRLMLEDTQRPPPPPKPPTDPSNVALGHTASNSDTTFGNSTSIRNRYLNNDSRNTTGALSPSLSPRHSSSAGSSLDLTSSPPFCDSSIDPNLETASLDGTYKTSDNPTTAINSVTTGIADQSNPDAVLQALFNDNFSNEGSYNFNDNLFSGINWSEVFNVSNESSGGFDENKSQQQTTMASLSPLRITDGQHNAAQPSNSQSSPSLPPINIGNDPSNRLVTDAQSQTSGIEHAANKVESLEAAIERLVGSLPDSIEYQLPLDLDSNPIGKSHTQNANLFQASTVPSRSDYSGSHDTHADFDTDAFIRTFVSSANEDQTDSANGVRASNLNPRGYEASGMISTSPPLEEGGIGRRSNTDSGSTSTTRIIEQSADQESKGLLTAMTVQEPLDTLDLDRILDEWTCEDAALMSTGLGINPGRLASSLSKSSVESSDLRGLNKNQHHQRNYELGEESSGAGHQILSSLNPSSCGTSSQRLIDLTSGGSKSSASSSSRLTLDLNDDDQLRRIMRKKNPASSSGITGANDPKNGGTGIMMISNNGKNGGDQAASIINLIGSSNSNSNNTNDQNPINKNNDHHANSMKKRFLEDSNHQSFHNLIPSHHFDDLNDLGDVNDQSKSSSVTLQQKKSRIY